MSTIRQRDGDCRAFTMDGSSYSLRREDYEPLLAAWMAGNAFFTGHTTYGAPVTIKLSRVEGVMDCSPEIVAIADDDAREERKEEMLNGDG